MDSHALVWPLELGIWTSMLWCGLSSSGYGLLDFTLVPQVGDMDLHASVWPCELRIWTPML